MSLTNQKLKIYLEAFWREQGVVWVVLLNLSLFPSVKHHWPPVMVPTALACCLPAQHQYCHSLLLQSCLDDLWSSSFLLLLSLLLVVWGFYVCLFPFGFGFGGVCFFPKEKLVEPTSHFLYLKYVITGVSSAVLDASFLFLWISSDLCSPPSVSDFYVSLQKRSNSTSLCQLINVHCSS